MGTNKSASLRYRLFFLLMFCFAAAILGDSTAESLMLARFGTSFIPRMFLVNAASLFIMSAGMLSIVDRLDRRKFFTYALIIHGIVLLLMRVAVSAKLDVLFLPLFSYAYSSKILFFLLFWTVANDLIDSRSAGKEFPAIAAGGTVGAIAVSFAIPVLMRYIAVENLLLLWAILVILASILLIPLREEYRKVINEVRPSPREAPRVVSPLSMTVLLREEPLLRNMSILYTLVFFLLLNQHFVFYRTIKDMFGSAETIASFLGGFTGVSMLLTCVLQISIAGILMRKLGSTRSMLLLPSALLAVFVLQLVVYSIADVKSSTLFAVIVGGMGLRLAFFDAFFSPNFQLFFSSLPKDMRGRGKLLIEGVVKPCSMVIAGLFLLWIAPAIPLQLHLVLMAVIAVAAFIQTLRLKRAYTRTLTRYLTGIESHRKDALLSRFNFGGGEDFLTFFAKRLEDEDFEVQKFLIEIIAEAGNDEAASLLLEYVTKADYKLRATVVIALGRFPAEIVGETLESFLHDSDPRVVANAVQSLATCQYEAIATCLPPLLHHPNQRVRINVILALWPQADAVNRQDYIEQLQNMLYGNSAEDMASALYVLGELKDETCAMMLYSFCRVKAESGMHTSMVFTQSIRALEKKQSAEALKLLLLIAGSSTALQRMNIIGKITSLLAFIPQNEWFKGFEKGNTVYKNCLLRAMRDHEFELLPNNLEMLNRIASRESNAIEWEKESIKILIESGSDKMALLACAIREEVVSLRLDNLLSIAALLDQTGGIHSALPRLFHTDRHVRARAFEVLENSGDIRYNRMIISSIEWLDALSLSMEHGKSSVGAREFAAAGSYSASHNRWVSICANYACSENHSNQG